MEEKGTSKGSMESVDTIPTSPTRDDLQRQYDAYRAKTLDWQNKVKERDARMRQQLQSSTQQLRDREEEINSLSKKMTVMEEELEEARKIQGEKVKYEIQNKEAIREAERQAEKKFSEELNATRAERQRTREKVTALETSLSIVKKDALGLSFLETTKAETDTSAGTDCEIVCRLLFDGVMYCLCRRKIVDRESENTDSTSGGSATEGTSTGGRGTVVGTVGRGSSMQDELWRHGYGCATTRQREFELRWFEQSFLEKHSSAVALLSSAPLTENEKCHAEISKKLTEQEARLRKKFEQEQQKYGETFEEKSNKATSEIQHQLQQAQKEALSLTEQLKDQKEEFKQQLKFSEEKNWAAEKEINDLKENFAEAQTELRRLRDEVAVQNQKLTESESYKAKAQLVMKNLKERGAKIEAEKEHLQQRIQELEDVTMRQQQQQSESKEETKTVPAEKRTVALSPPPQELSTDSTKKMTNNNSESKKKGTCPTCQDYRMLYESAQKRVEELDRAYEDLQATKVQNVLLEHHNDIAGLRKEVEELYALRDRLHRESSQASIQLEQYRKAKHKAATDGSAFFPGSGDETTTADDSTSIAAVASATVSSPLPKEIVGSHPITSSTSWYSRAAQVEVMVQTDAQVAPTEGTAVALSHAETETSIPYNNKNNTGHSSSKQVDMTSSSSSSFDRTKRHNNNSHIGGSGGGDQFSFDAFLEASDGAPQMLPTPAALKDALLGQSRRELREARQEILQLRAEIRDYSVADDLHTEQENMLKNQIRELERSEQRATVLAEKGEYVKNVVVKFASAKENAAVQKSLVPVLSSLLNFSPEELRSVEQALK